MAILLVSVLKRKISKMSKINVSQWKKFKLSSMFDVTTSKSVDRRYLDFVDDSDAVNFVGRGTLNNGIQGRILPEHVSFKPNSAYTMSLSQIGNNWATWHDTPWFASQNVFVLTPISEKLAGRKARYFIQSVINRNLIMYYNCGYEKYPKQSDIRDMVLTLPVDSSGNPDWQYMDEYIAKLATQAHTNISLLRQQQKKAPTVNIDRWKEFKLPELFTVSSGTKFDKRRVILTPEPHNINFIGRTGSLNGINAKCGIYKNTEPFSAGLLTVALGGTIGACFVQDKPFYTSQNVDVLIPLKCYVSKMTWNVKQFIASCIFYESQNNYLTFVRELNKHIKRDFVIKLPVDSTGHPDWQYMDNYISSIQQAQKERVARLTSIVK